MHVDGLDDDWPFEIAVFFTAAAPTDPPKLQGEASGGQSVDGGKQSTEVRKVKNFKARVEETAGGQCQESSQDLRRVGDSGRLGGESEFDDGDEDEEDFEGEGDEIQHHESDAFSDYSNVSDYKPSWERKYAKLEKKREKRREKALYEFIPLEEKTVGAYAIHDRQSGRNIGFHLWHTDIIRGDWDY
uniref:Uncharacterized protein n=1 Tax=Chromera velia CCMP2878 TaxID=1169474 RepID=A0A0G4I1L0_9ALVE|eukprot:Cvel_10143.t1-p1 / transcript=Cvel_10143.t1 / gene=Cvel_10143 / organism=Chromera_velia_CCMP2878 / gene_product=hypothetical protein / transcript_product=hypothetical protein / location=Cvel_scaffold605:15254-17478(+) / protein_length=186 / sequence_SO=supercontig / SO=protein_coding / is_pseudo=false